MNKLSISVDMGHPFGCGAFGIMSETDGNRLVGNLLISKLEALGHTVYNCTYDINVNELANRVALANAHTSDYFISLHMDCYDNASANGVTIYTTENSSAKSKAIEVINAIADSCNYNNRGWKSANFYVLKNTNAPAMLVEMGFVSSQVDCDKFNAEKISNAIVKALTGQTVQSTSTDKSGWRQDETGIWYVYSNGSYPKNQWFKLGQDWFYADEKGYCYQNRWIKYKDKWYYLKNDGKMACNETLTYQFNINGEWIPK